MLLRPSVCGQISVCGSFWTGHKKSSVMGGMRGGNTSLIGKKINDITCCDSPAAETMCVSLYINMLIFTLGTADKGLYRAHLTVCIMCPLNIRKQTLS